MAPYIESCSVVIKKQTLKNEKSYCKLGHIQEEHEDKLQSTGMM